MCVIHAGSKKEEEEEVSPAAYIAPVVALICALVGIVILLVVLIRRRKRKRRQGHLSQLHSPDPVMSPEAAFYKKSGQFSPISLLSPQSTCAAFSDPLEFPRNQLYVYTKKVLGRCGIIFLLFTHNDVTLICTIERITQLE